MSGVRLLVGLDVLPRWLHPMASALAGSGEDEFSLLRPPPGMPVRESAVLVLFSEGTGAGPDVLLIERASGMSFHAGQAAFPGGVHEDTDGGPVGAALREAAEETCLEPGSVTPVAVLPRLWIPPTGFAVEPVVAWWHSPMPVEPGDAAEVAAVHRVAIGELTDPAARVRVRHPSGYIGPGFEARGMLVWGFTGGLLDRLCAAAGWGRPWKPGRMVEVDATGRVAPGGGTRR